MKQKKSVVLMLICMMQCLSTPLVADASYEQLDFLGELDELVGIDDALGNLSELGFANDMAITVFIEDEAAVDPEDDEYYRYSVELEPTHFYRVDLDFFINVDEANLDKYDDINMQIRFPTTLMANNPNALSVALYGEKIQTWSDFVGLSSAGDIDLYYIEDSGMVATLTKDGHIMSPSVDDLFCSEHGIPIGGLLRTETFDKTMEVRGHQIAYLHFTFELYAAPHYGKISSEDIALDYWAGQRILLRRTPSPAPAASYASATIDENGAIHLHGRTTSEAEVRDAANREGGKILAFLGVVAVGIIILAIRHSAHERGITGFKNILLDLIQAVKEDT